MIRRKLTWIVGSLWFLGVGPVAQWAQWAQWVHAVEAPYQHQLEGPRIRVRLEKKIQQFKIRGLDLRVRSLADRTLVPSSGRSEWRVSCGANRIHFSKGKGFPKELKQDLPSPVSFQAPSGFLHFKGLPYRDEIRVFARGRRCEVINVLAMEKYLDGLVNAEFNSRWDPDAVAAQVVAARTYALFQLRRARKIGKHFDLEATISDQLYTGPVEEDPSASRVVGRTRGLILVRKGTPIKAFYHSTCGGRTELPESVWGRKHPGFRAVRCSFCQSSPRYQWSLSFAQRDLSQKILSGVRRRGAPKDWPSNWKSVLKDGKLENFHLEKRGSGRVDRLQSIWRVAGGKWVKLPIKATTFRGWLDVAKFRSTAFSVSVREKKFLFLGRGNGHGVGMCQWGAKVMGEKGHTFRKILGHYYPGARIRKLW